MKSQNNTRMWVGQTGVLAFLALLSCDESQPSVQHPPTRTHVETGVSNREVKRPRTQPNRFGERHDRTSDEELQNTFRIVTEDGPRALQKIYDTSTGIDRDHRLTAALSILANDYSKTDLLKILASLPPTEYKQKWIWLITEKGQGPFDSAFFSAVASLDYQEEKKAALSSYASSSRISNSDDLKSAVDSIKDIEGLNAQYKKILVDKLFNSYLSSTPVFDASVIELLPSSSRKHAVSVAAGFVMSEGDFASGVNFAKNVFESSIPESRNLGSEAYYSVFNRLGRDSPAKVTGYLAGAPTEIRDSAIEGFMRGWLSQDPDRAAVWAQNLPDNDKKTAVKTIIEYLEENNSPREEIAPWADMASSLNKKK